MGTKTIYEMVVDAVENYGAHFKVDIIHRNLLLGNGRMKYIVKGGKYEGNLGVDTSMTTMDVLDEIERLYDSYYVSVSSTRGVKSLFGKSRDRMSRDSLLFSESTNTAQIRLEAFILLSILAGTFKWTEDVFGSHCFWQSKRNKNLVIFKNWIVNETDKKD